jgi:hypothetical protein
MMAISRHTISSGKDPSQDIKVSNSLTPTLALNILSSIVEMFLKETAKRSIFSFLKCYSS